MNPLNPSFWSSVSILMMIFLPCTVYGSVDFFVLNGFSTNSSQAVTFETCAYNATNSRLCVITDIYTFGYSTLVSFDTPSTTLYNMTMAAYYTTQPNILLTSAYFEPDYNITSYNVFLVVNVKGFTEIKPGVYDLIPEISGQGGQPVATNTVEFITIDLFYTQNYILPTTANIPSFSFYYGGVMSFTVDSESFEFLFQEFSESYVSGEGYYMYAQPFNLNWIFPDGSIQDINNPEAYCRVGQLLVNVGIGYIYPNGTSVSAAVLLMPPMPTPSPTIVPTMYPTYFLPPSYPVDDNTVDDDTSSTSSGFSSLNNGEKAGVIIVIIFGGIALIISGYLVYRQFFAIEKDSAKDDLIGNQHL